MAINSPGRKLSVVFRPGRIKVPIFSLEISMKMKQIATKALERGPQSLFYLRAARLGMEIKMDIYISIKEELKIAAKSCTITIKS